MSTKMLKKGKKDIYVAKNGDTGEKRKTYQSNQIIWIYRFLNIQRQDADFFELPKALHREWVHIFCLKSIWLFVTLETVCYIGIWNLGLSFYLYGNSFVI